MSSADSEDPTVADASTVHEEKKSAGKFATLWGKLGLDAGTLMMMAKGALPPTIFTAMYQNSTIAATYGTMGYLVTIVASLSMCILPRAKLVQLTIQNSIAVCLGSATALFGLWTATIARSHNPSSPTSAFNGSAAAVSAAWLFANIWLVNVFRAKFPALSIPVILYTIFISVVFTYGPLLTMPRAISIVVLLLKAFMTGFALSLVVGLVVIPVNCRMVWWRGVGGYLEGCKKLLKEQKTFMQQYEDISSYDTHKPSTDKSAPPPLSVAQKTHSDLFAKLTIDLPMAKRETAIGHYTTRDLRATHKHLQATVLPLQGMTAILDIFDRGVAHAAANEDGECHGKEQFSEVMRVLREPYGVIGGLCEEAVEHTMILLELGGRKQDKKATDVEEGAVKVAGQIGFCDVLQERVETFYATRTDEIKSHFKAKVPVDVGDMTRKAQTMLDDDAKSMLYLVLFMEHLLRSASESLLSLARFAEATKASGILDRRRFVYPSLRRVKKWLLSADGGGDDVVDSIFRRRAGYRGVACATMVVAAPGFFESSYVFFNEKRLMWAMIMVAIGMSPTSGASLVGFIGRIVGTVMAVIFAFVNWYIVDGNTAGVIVLLWFFVAIQFYFIIKIPQTIQSVFTAMITQIMIIGYELQVRVVGIPASEASGQPVLGINDLGWYRLLVTLAGIGVAFFFTVFPYPTSTRSRIRSDVAAELYLLAQSYSNTISLVRMRIDGTAGDETDRYSHGAVFEKRRAKLMTSSIIALDSLRRNSAMTVFEPSLRGAWPKAHYDHLIDVCASISTYLSIIAFASRSFSHSSQAWVRDLSALLKTMETRSPQVTGLLCLLSTSLAGGRPLPPAVVVPGPYGLSKALEERDAEILGIERCGEEGYIAFAVLQVAVSILVADLGRLVGGVEGLVGSVEFPGDFGVGEKGKVA
ncbi:uncharacterized protein LAJ45_03527 [Morchella importuna]|uniref:uncharacterized protein n=1 Tax=Morchella importuna TaxID=1174673 RepID=UPI001E8E4668|nr:uncharacterized protein LAJ45_03527 [Morchella importuna]KAH8152686.1 hypothetical protein LAJ45_03527 [Morchella importuna]